MSAVPTDDRNRPHPEMCKLGWQARSGLTMSEAEQLLDHLENAGVQQREVSIDADGVTVRWRGIWPRLATEGET